jgi:hypothetical protein
VLACRPTSPGPASLLPHLQLLHLQVHIRHQLLHAVVHNQGLPLLIPAPPWLLLLLLLLPLLLLFFNQHNITVFIPLLSCTGNFLQPFRLTVLPCISPPPLPVCPHTCINQIVSFHHVNKLDSGCAAVIWP